MHLRGITVCRACKAKGSKIDYAQQMWFLQGQICVCERDLMDALFDYISIEVKMEFRRR